MCLFQWVWIANPSILPCFTDSFVSLIFTILLLFRLFWLICNIIFFQAHRRKGWIWLNLAWISAEDK